VRAGEEQRASVRPEGEERARPAGKATPPDVSVVIVTWKVVDLVETCLRTLIEGTERATLEILVIDNDSRDGTLEMIAEKFPAVTAIDTGANLGFSGGNNHGFARATGRHVLLLNPDTEVAPGAVDRLVEALDASPDLGLVGPKVLLPSGKIQLPCARRFPTLWNQALEILGVSQKYPAHPVFGHYRMGFWDHGDERDVEAVSGCCLLVRRELLDRVGRLDESFFMYGEDLDLCWRVRRTGARIRYVPSAEILHLSESSSAQDEHRMFIETFESMYRFFRKNRGALAAFAYRLITGGVSAAWWVLENGRAAVVGGEKARALRSGPIPMYRAIVDWSLRGSLRGRFPS
jgi:GT2 family glycosyltransferase